MPAGRDQKLAVDRPNLIASTTSGLAGDGVLVGAPQNEENVHTYHGLEPQAGP